VGGTGLEHPSKSSGFRGFLPEGGAKSGAVGVRIAISDPDLAAVVEAWPTLPEAVRRQVVGLVKAQNKP
jgi:hypothetical protein